jgi:hypothetical protein
MVVMAALAALFPLAALVGGCGPTEPKLADAPVFKAEPEKEAQKIPGRNNATPYGGSKKYQDAYNK